VSAVHVCFVQVNVISDLSMLEKEYPLLVAVNRAAHSEFSYLQT